MLRWIVRESPRYWFGLGARASRASKLEWICDKAKQEKAKSEAAGGQRRAPGKLPKWKR